MQSITQNVLMFSSKVTEALAFVSWQNHKQLSNLDCQINQNSDFLLLFYCFDMKGKTEDEFRRWRERRKNVFQLIIRNYMCQ